MLIVMVVEDHPLNRKLLRDILEMQFDAAGAVAAEGALELLQSVRPQGILRDVRLRGRDGLPLVRLLKKNRQWASIPIIGVSAHAGNRDIEAARAAGCVDYI